MDRANDECMIFSLEELAAFVDHPDRYARRNELLKHLADCAICRERVAQAEKSKRGVPDTSA